MNQIALKDKHIDRRIAEVMRLSYGKLIALLCAKYRDIELCEDALADAFAQALQKWPQTTIPQNCEAWLYHVARNKILDHLKSASHQTSSTLDVEDVEAITNMPYANKDNQLPDERLRLMFACAHPAIDSFIRTPLILQVIMGVDSKKLANLYVVSATTMAQRLVRAKQKIKLAKIPYTLPTDANLDERLGDVLEAVYGAYALDWQMIDLDFYDSQYGEAKYLIDLLVNKFPKEPEVLGLAALIGFSMARQNNEEIFIALEDQDPNTWDRQLIAESEALLARASRIEQVGRFQLEAAIQSAHCARRKNDETDWVAISQLYYGLMQVAPTLGAGVAMSAALGRAYGAERGLAELQKLNDQAVISFQPYWATKAYLFAQNGQYREAIAAYDRAIELCDNARIIAYLQEQQSRLNRDHKLH